MDKRIVYKLVGCGILTAFIILFVMLANIQMEEAAKPLESTPLVQESLDYWEKTTNYVEFVIARENFPEELIDARKAVHTAFTKRGIDYSEVHNMSEVEQLQYITALDDEAFGIVARFTGSLIDYRAPPEKVLRDAMNTVCETDYQVVEGFFVITGGDIKIGAILFMMPLVI